MATPELRELIEMAKEAGLEGEGVVRFFARLASETA